MIVEQPYHGRRGLVLVDAHASSGRALALQHARNLLFACAELQDG
jgi:hypothetical protein